jgi:SSS family solute:Na+ symporter
MFFAALMLKAESVLDVWWQLSGIFGGGILGLFLLSLMRVRIKRWQGITAIVVALLFIFWGSFIRQGDPIHVVGLLKHILSETAVDSILCRLDKIIVGALGAGVLVDSILCRLDKIIVGALGAGVLIAVALLLALTNRGQALPQQPGQEQENA